MLVGYPDESAGSVTTEGNFVSQRRNRVHRIRTWSNTGGVVGSEGVPTRWWIRSGMKSNDWCESISSWGQAITTAPNRREAYTQKGRSVQVLMQNPRKLQIPKIFLKRLLFEGWPEKRVEKEKKEIGTLGCGCVKGLKVRQPQLC